MRNRIPINEVASMFAGVAVFIPTLDVPNSIQTATTVACSILTVFISQTCGRVDAGDADKTVKQREILTIIHEVLQPDRRGFDFVILDALALTQRERDGVYEAVVDPVEARLSKAKSLQGQ